MGFSINKLNVISGTPKDFNMKVFNFYFVSNKIQQTYKQKSAHTRLLVVMGFSQDLGSKNDSDSGFFARLELGSTKARLNPS